MHTRPVSGSTVFKTGWHAPCLLFRGIVQMKGFPLPRPGRPHCGCLGCVFFMAEGGGVGPPRPLSEPTPVRAERTCRCTKPSVVPTGGIEPPSLPYERSVTTVGRRREILEPLPGTAPGSAAYKAAVLLLNESGVEPAASVDLAPQHYQCRVQSRYTTPAGARGGNCTPIASMSRSHSALELRGRKIGRAPRTCAALLLHPKQAGRYLPLSP